jgi:hypothetical protein
MKLNIKIEFVFYKNITIYFQKPTQGFQNDKMMVKCKCSFQRCPLANLIFKLSLEILGLKQRFDVGSELVKFLSSSYSYHF